MLLLSAAVFFAPSFNAFPRLSLLGTPLSLDLVVGEGGAGERGAVLLLLLTLFHLILRTSVVRCLSLASPVCLRYHDPVLAAQVN